jgi:hypothetical protein
MRHQQSCNEERGFFKLLELASQPLTIFIEILQRFIAVHKVKIRGFAKLHALDALMRQLLIFIFKYLSGILLYAENGLQIGLRCLQLVYSGLKICKSSRTRVRLLQKHPQ